MLKTKDLRDQTSDELKALYRDLSREIYSLKCELSIARKLEKPHLIRTKKRDRAKVLTIMRQKELAQ